MLFNIMLYIILAYILLFAALFNAMCLYNVFLAIDLLKCFFHALSLVIDT